MKFQSLPLDKIFITQYFGANSNFYVKYGMKGHNGVDFRTRFIDSPLGHREILAVNDGVVSRVVVAKSGGYGTYVQIQHPDGSMTIYGHQYKPHVVVGCAVKAGDVIGITDNTGDSSGPHLHLGYRPKNFDINNGFKGYVDPLPFLPLKN
jgi:murein DD-endopeptidase MepM/ murein hydrolase activator NlpD